MHIVRAVVPTMESVGNFQWGSNNAAGVFYPNEESFAQDFRDGTLWVVEDELSADGGGPSVVGVAALTVDQPEEYGAAGLDLNTPSVVPHRLAVHPAMQGRGVARMLYNKAELMAQECGWDRVRVDTCTINVPMNKLIQSLGYKRYGEFTFPGKADGLRFVAYEKVLSS